MSLQLQAQPVTVRDFLNHWKVPPPKEELLWGRSISTELNLDPGCFDGITVPQKSHKFLQSRRTAWFWPHIKTTVKIFSTLKHGSHAKVSLNANVCVRIIQCQAINCCSLPSALSQLHLGPLWTKLLPSPMASALTSQSLELPALESVHLWTPRSRWDLRWGSIQVGHCGPGWLGGWRSG